MFAAEIVADSLNEFGNRLTTFKITFPRIILAELNTHRMLSKNSASSRAIPFAKMLESVETNPFIPLRWMKDHKGMQGTEYFEDEREIKILLENWNHAKAYALFYASKLSQNGVTKQFCNRLLEPFMWHTVLISGTEWDNFFGLRVHEAAEIHMQKIASMMLEVYNASEPKRLEAGEWHIPFENQMSRDELMRALERDIPEIAPVNERDFNDPINQSVINQLKVKISTVMAARTSYTVVGADQKPLSYPRMIEIHDEMRDAQPKHMSPFEHCAQAMSKDDYDFNHVTAEHIRVKNPEWSLIQYSNTEHGWSGNYRGFKQYRKMIENENINNDNRVKKWK